MTSIKKDLGKDRNSRAPEPWADHALPAHSSGDVLSFSSGLSRGLIAMPDCNSRPHLALRMGAMAFEKFTQRLETGAFVVLLGRLTQKHFSAIQYTLFASLFGLPRVVRTSLWIPGQCHA